MGARQVVSFCAIPTLTPREVKNLILLFVGAPLVSRLLSPCSLTPYSSLDVTKGLQSPCWPQQSY